MGRWESRTQSCTLIPVPHWAEGRGEVPGQRPPEWLELFPQLISFLGQDLLGDCLVTQSGSGRGEAGTLWRPGHLRALELSEPSVGSL